MNKSIKMAVFLLVSVLYIVGNNQIAYADISMNSKSSIYFDQSYFPPEVDPLIPSGSTEFPVHTSSRILPKTNDTNNGYLIIIGYTLFASGIVITRYKYKKKENIF